MTGWLAILLAATALPGAAVAQSMPGMADMPGTAHPAPPTPAAAAARSSSDPSPAVGDALPPTAPTDHYADRVYNPAAMAMARMQLRDEHGGMAIASFGFDLLEYQARGGRDGYRWEGGGWFGSDVDRVVLKTEGEGDRGRVETAEVQALYARAIDPYWNVEVGARFDPAPGRDTGYAVVAIEGLAPYGFDVQAAAFLSHRGDLLARLEGKIDQRLTRRLTVQPRVELNFAARDVAATRTGAGLSSAEIGARLRYRLSTRIQPYVGLSWERRLGATARYFRANGDSASEHGVVFGTALLF